MALTKARLLKHDFPVHGDDPSLGGTHIIGAFLGGTSGVFPGICLSLHSMGIAIMGMSRLGVIHRKHPGDKEDSFACAFCCCGRTGAEAHLRFFWPKHFCSSYSFPAYVLRVFARGLSVRELGTQK